jgi:predicted  nucleic acid-binding Zn ribbon protein
MFSAQVCFPVSGQTKAQVADAVQALLASWYKQGQILDGWVLAAREGDIVAYVALPARDALSVAFANKYVRADLAKLDELGAEPLVEVLGEYPGLDRGCECEAWEWLILFTNFLAREPPARCGQCFLPVPLYRILTSQDDEHVGILHWAADYKACDTLQMHTETGERFGERQQAHHDSSLSVRGRELCRALDARVGVPMYYYLHESRGRNRTSEADRRCPGCGGEWRLPEVLHIFDFKCDGCRLLSSIACSVR